MDVVGVAEDVGTTVTVLVTTTGCVDVVDCSVDVVLGACELVEGFEEVVEGAFEDVVGATVVGSADDVVGSAEDVVDAADDDVDGAVDDVEGVGNGTSVGVGDGLVVTGTSGTSMAMVQDDATRPTAHKSAAVSVDFLVLMSDTLQQTFRTKFTSRTVRPGCCALPHRRQITHR